MTLNPEYTELTDPNNNRREIIFEMYVTAFDGCIRIIVRAYGRNVKICTVFVKKNKDKNPKEGDKYIDGKKKPSE